MVKGRIKCVSKKKKREKKVAEGTNDNEGDER